MTSHAELRELLELLRAHNHSDHGMRVTAALPCPDGVDLIPLGRTAEQQTAEVAR